MSTVKLVCTNCSNPFEKDRHEIARRKAKTQCSATNWFCTRSCAVSFSNRARLAFGRNNNPPPPQYGNTYGQRYDPNITWYIHRMYSDSRKQLRLAPDLKKEMHDHLLQIWTGKCAITQRPIVRRRYKQTKTTTNPFQLASVDRIDCNKPYVVGNVRWVCLALNLARNNTDVVLFDSYVQEFLSSS